MAVKLNSLSRWSELPSDKAIVFAGSDLGERTVRLNLNLEAATSFFIGNDDEERFLVTMPAGVDTVEFSVAGTFRVYAEEGSGAVLYQSADLEPTYAEVVDPVIFTKIANRRHRNPELEEMMFRMNQNLERRLQQQAGELQAAFERRVREEENGRSPEIVVSHAPGAASGAGSEQIPAQGAAGEESGETSLAPNSGEQQGGASGGQAGTGGAA
ncbi:hypothetical protein G6L96_025725 (plasmid) [Agrobacterium tumefaciens]|uniref:hypothetical protein n=1 Tax=Agrobacterium tumefaciens TaxID=358 RepID=UPI00157353F1|nr:hypothetical protein [Agrobacterium tumefaciens]WCK74270.1 hypothetical protein G6L96_025725 [Agrobacterium tumefaciens]